ncbi:MAG: hypothetical protein MUP76_02630 [Acidimicrobiia bacterium]|nr:hypothetical protein [Acidimicrobiia bacterium]
MTPLRRSGSVLMAAAVWLVVGAAPALADPPGPTDYQTEVIGIDPATPGFRVEVIGGDSFILIHADPGTSLEVTGYRGEPYLRFLADGTVEQNDHSPTTYYNVDRYGVADIPAEATADAEPSWSRVATDGSFAWHDHRAHWMNTARPLGREPGDVILERVVPLVVGGVEVDVTVRSIWQPPPSTALPLAGMALGLAVVAAAALRRSRVVVLAGVLAALAAAAAVLGVVAVVSVPAETSPPWSLWVPPLAALALGAAALGGRWIPALHRSAPSSALIGALVLTAWGFLHQEWMWRAVLPTNGPFWAERVVTGAVIVAGIGLVMLIGRAQVMGAEHA